MKPSGSSSRRQRSPTRSWSTCGDRERRGLGWWGPPGKRRSPSSHPHPGEGWNKGAEGAAREPPGRAGRTCRRGDLSAGRLELSVEDMLARRGRRASRALDSPAWRLWGPRWRCGLLTRGEGRERWGGAGGRRRPGLQAGEASGGRAAVRAHRGRGRCAAPPAAESPRVRFKLVKLASELGRRVTWRALGNPSSRPLLPGLCLLGVLKGPLASVGSAAARGLKFFARSLQGQSRGRHHGRSNPLPKSRTSLTPWCAPAPAYLSRFPWVWSRFPLLPHPNTQNLKDFHKVLSGLKVLHVTGNKPLASKSFESRFRRKGQ